MNELALKIENLTKEYRLGTIGYGTIREDMQSWWAKVRGKEDPNSLVTDIHNSISDKKHFLALQDINLKVEKGDRVGIIGRNGAGKSTLLKILSRITSPTKGNIYLNGRVGSLLEVGTGFHSELTGRENIYLNGSILGMKKHEIDRKLDEIVDFAGIEQFIDTPVKRYSSGMFVRLGFAVAAHLEPEILIVDEVLAVGDIEFQKKAIGKMEDVSNNEGRTILFVSHNMSSVKRLCKSGIVLEKGTVKFMGHIKDAIGCYENQTANTDTFKNRYVEELDMSIENISISNGKDNNIKSFDPLIIELELISGRNHERLGTQFFLRRNDADNLIFTSNAYSHKNVSVDLKKGKNYVRLTIPSFNCAAGEYFLGIGIDLPFHKWYFLEKDMLKFTVNKAVLGDSNILTDPNAGLVYLDHNWKVGQRN